jgi:hypothetical protein
VVSNCSPNNVIVASREQAPFAVHFQSLPIGPEYRSVVTHKLHSGVTLRDPIEREGEIVMEPEGIESPRPGRS